MGGKRSTRAAGDGTRRRRRVGDDGDGFVWDQWGNWKGKS